MMLRLLIPLFLVALVRGYTFHGAKYSAASPAQIRFAYENKFDDTGPGAKEPEYAYKVHKNLEDALLAYLDDPDTQLPQNERARAIANLYRSEHNTPYDPLGKKKLVPIVFKSYVKHIDDNSEFVPPNQFPYDTKKSMWFDDMTRRFKDINYHYQYKPSPDVEFSVDVHDKETGDLKTSQELRDGSGTIHGYYTTLDRSGRTHTLQFESNPLNGLRSEVRRVL